MQCIYVSTIWKTASIEDNCLETNVHSVIIGRMQMSIMKYFDDLHLGQVKISCDVTRTLAFPWLLLHSCNWHLHWLMSTVRGWSAFTCAVSYFLSHRDAAPVIKHISVWMTTTRIMQQHDVLHITVKIILGSMLHIWWWHALQKLSFSEHTSMLYNIYYLFNMESH
jgi:hypothetical protein